MDFEYNKLGIKEPDKVIFLHASFELVTAMRNKIKTNEGVSNDIHERDLSFMRNVYDSSFLVADDLSWDEVECSKAGQMRSIADIHEEVYRLVKRKTNK